jgi:hypothetical protein
MHFFLERRPLYFMLNALLELTPLSLAAAQAIETPRYSADTPRERQLELVRSAAPPEISGKATLFILGKKGSVVRKKQQSARRVDLDRRPPSTMPGGIQRRILASEAWEALNKTLKAIELAALSFPRDGPNWKPDGN